MSNRKTGLIMVVCLLIGACVGIAGAQAVEVAQRRYLNTGLFSLSTDQVARFRVSLDDHAGAPPARVVLQWFSPTGASLGKRETSLLPGQSTTLQTSGPGVFRAHAEVIDPDLPLSPRRAPVASLEVVDTLTGIVRPTCGFNPWPIPPGR